VASEPFPNLVIDDDPAREHAASVLDDRLRIGFGEARLAVQMVMDQPPGWEHHLPSVTDHHDDADQIAPFIRQQVAAWHFRRFMAAVGHDPSNGDNHLSDTPGRVARMYLELLNGADFAFTTFPAENADQMIVVRDIPFSSFCAHHFLPFTGVAHIAYIPSDKMAGLSKLARAVVHLARRPQVQERLTEQVADFIWQSLNARGAAVRIDARHECMELRGVRAIGAITTTTALRGLLHEDQAARAEFYSIIGSK
jgi:GTP cyclohydrolase I